MLGETIDSEEDTVTLETGEQYDSMSPRTSSRQFWVFSRRLFI